MAAHLLQVPDTGCQKSELALLAQKPMPDSRKPCLHGGAQGTTAGIMNYRLAKEQAGRWLCLLRILAAIANDTAQAVNGLVVKQSPQRQTDPEFILQPIDQRDCFERMPATLKKIIKHAYRGNVQLIPPEFSDLEFDLISGRHKFVGIGVRGLWQSVPINLAVGGKRQRGHLNERAGHHINRQLFSGVLAQFGSIHAAIANIICQQSLRSVIIRNR